MPPTHPPTHPPPRAAPPVPLAKPAPAQGCIGNAGQGITPINPKTQPSWVAWQMAEWGYSTINAHNATHLSMTWYDDATNTAQHAHTIVRNFPRGY